MLKKSQRLRSVVLVAFPIFLSVFSFQAEGTIVGMVTLATMTTGQTSLDVQSQLSTQEEQLRSSIRRKGAQALDLIQSTRELVPKDEVKVWEKVEQFNRANSTVLGRLGRDLGAFDLNHIMSNAWEASKTLDELLEVTKPLFEDPQNKGLWIDAVSEINGLATLVEVKSRIDSMNLATQREIDKAAEKLTGLTIYGGLLDDLNAAKVKFKSSAARSSVGAEVGWRIVSITTTIGMGLLTAGIGLLAAGAGGSGGIAAAVVGGAVLVFDAPSGSIIQQDSGPTLVRSGLTPNLEKSLLDHMAKKQRHDIVSFCRYSLEDMEEFLDKNDFRSNEVRLIARFFGLEEEWEELYG